MLLALETSTNVCSVAFEDEESNVFEKRIEKRGSHSEKLFLFIEELMEERGFKIADLEAVLVSEGPGSYTGLRISASAVKGLLFKTNVPLYAVNTLAGFAQSVINEGMKSNTIHSVIDARRVHVYHQLFAIEGENLVPKSEVEIVPIEEFQQSIGEGEVIVGTGLKRLDEGVLVKVSTYDLQHITAKSLIALFNSDDRREDNLIKKVSPEAFEPSYYTSYQVNN